MTRQLVAVVPFRSLYQGKSRLAPELADRDRRKLVAAMLGDTLESLRKCALLDQVLLLTDDTEAAALARGLGVAAVGEPAGARGLNAVVQQLANDLASDYDELLVVHGDVPLVQAEELEQLILAHRRLAVGRPAVSLVPDRHQSGSNGLLCSPVNSMRFYYGPDSLAKHLAFARVQGLQSQTVELAGAGLDIDEPADLDCLKAHPGLARAARVHYLLA